MKKKGWIGVDLDGTVARYESGDYAKYGGLHIGEPIPEMVTKIHQWNKDGYEVKLVTARALQGPEVLEAIREWCRVHIGYTLTITNEKDRHMICLYDDRARHVQKNTGKVCCEHE